MAAGSSAPELFTSIIGDKHIQHYTPFNHFYLFIYFSHPACSVTCTRTLYGHAFTQHVCSKEMLLHYSKSHESAVM